MTLWEVLLVFIGCPVGVFLLLAAAVYGAGSRHSRRYRPGRPFEFAPVWFVASPKPIVGLADLPAEPEEIADQPRALESAATAGAGSPHGVKGGASGSW